MGRYGLTYRFICKRRGYHKALKKDVDEMIEKKLVVNVAKCQTCGQGFSMLLRDVMKDDV